MNTFAKSSRCPVCRCVVMVQKQNDVKHSLMRALALADHVKTLHSVRRWTDTYRVVQE